MNFLQLTYIYIYTYIYFFYPSFTVFANLQPRPLFLAQKKKTHFPPLPPLVVAVVVAFPVCPRGSSGSRRCCVGISGGSAFQAAYWKGKKISTFDPHSDVVMSPESPTQNHTKYITAKEKKRSLTYRFFNKVFQPYFFQTSKPKMSSFRSHPPVDPPPTLVTFGVVTLAIALVGLITLTLAAAVTLATLTRPRGLVPSGRSERRQSWAQHHRNLRVECTPNASPFLGRNHGDSHGKTNSNPKRALPGVPVWTNWIYQSQDPCWKLPSNPSLASRCWAHPGVISDKRHRGFCC